MSEIATGVVQHARELILREAAALQNLAGQIDESFVDVIEAVRNCAGKIVTTGAGTSGIMADRLAHLLSVSGTPSFFLSSQDALHGGMGAVTPDDLVIAFSKGGQSMELTELVGRLVERGTDVIAVTESPESPFAAAATRIVHLTTDPADADAGGLIALGSTLVVGAWGDALAYTLMGARGFSWEEVVQIHPAGIVGQQQKLPAAVTLDADGGGV